MFNCILEENSDKKMKENLFKLMKKTVENYTIFINALKASLVSRKEDKRQRKL